MKAVRIDRTGGPEVLQLVDLDSPRPKPGQIVVRNTFIGVNYIDTYHRTGLYTLPLPTGLGSEGAGIVAALGDGVTSLREGDRVAYATGGIGAYAEEFAIAADRVLKLPDGVNDAIAAASLLKGMTACYLLRKTFPVEQGHVALIYAAAGGVGQIAVQWAKRLRATIIAVVGDDTKASLVKALGADHVIVTSRETITDRVKEITNGQGVDVAYDSVGKDTFEATLKSLKPLGMFVSYGNASGAVPPFAPQILANNGSLFFTRPTLATYVRNRALLEETGSALFDVIASGAVKIAPPKIYPLSAAADAHRDLESRKTTGSLVLQT